MTPPQTRHYLQGNSRQNLHIFALFDPPKMGNLMIPEPTKVCVCFLSWGAVRSGGVRWERVLGVIFFPQLGSDNNAPASPSFLASILRRRGKKFPPTKKGNKITRMPICCFGA